MVERKCFRVTTNETVGVLCTASKNPVATIKALAKRRGVTVKKITPISKTMALKTQKRSTSRVLKFSSKTAGIRIRNQPKKRKR